MRILFHERKYFMRTGAYFIRIWAFTISKGVISRFNIYPTSIVKLLSSYKYLPWKNMNAFELFGICSRWIRSIYQVYSHTGGACVLLYASKTYYYWNVFAVFGSKSSIQYIFHVRSFFICGIFIICYRQNSIYVESFMFGFSCCEI